MGRIFPDDSVNKSTVPLYGVDANRIGTIRIPLDNARVNERLKLGAFNFFWAYRASRLNATIDVRFGHQRNPAVAVENGFSFQTKASEIYLTNDAQAGEWIEFLYVRDDGKDNGFAFSVAQGAFQEIKIDISQNTIVTVPDDSVASTTTEMILPTNTDRRKAILSNPFGNPREFRIGDSSTGAARGIELQPGATISLETTDAIYAYNPDAFAMSITIVEIEE